MDYSQEQVEQLISHVREAVEAIESAGELPNPSPYMDSYIREAEAIEGTLNSILEVLYKGLAAIGDLRGVDLPGYIITMGYSWLSDLTKALRLMGGEVDGTWTGATDCEVCVYMPHEFSDEDRFDDALRLKLGEVAGGGEYVGWLKIEAIDECKEIELTLREMADLDQ